MIKVEKKTSVKNLNTNVVKVKINLFMLKINKQIEKLAIKRIFTGIFNHQQRQGTRFVC